MYSIYELIDPMTNSTKYIGLTSRELNKRLSEHIRQRNREETHKARWIRKLINEGRKPIIKSIYSNIEKLDTALEYERETIKLYKEKGYDLTNSTNGGEKQKEFTKDICKKISEKLKEGFKNGKYQPYNKGRKLTDIEYDRNIRNRKKADNSGEKNSFFGKTHSAETIKIITEKNKKYNYDIDLLYKMYVIDNLLQKEISEIIGMSKAQICRLLKKYNIKKTKN